MQALHLQAARRRSSRDAAHPGRHDRCCLAPTRMLTHTLEASCMLCMTGLRLEYWRHSLEPVCFPHCCDRHVLQDKGHCFNCRTSRGQM